MSYRVIRNMGLALAFGFAALPLRAQDAGSGAPKVTVAAARTGDVTQSVTYIGKGEAIDGIDIVARVNGFIEEIDQEDGIEVQAGTRLFLIEQDAYEATLEARKADKAQAEANLDLMRLEFERKETLLERGSGTEADRDTALANQQVAAAGVKAAQAAIRQAELDLSYTEVRAPFDGRLGRILVSEGELVTPSSGPLVSLVRTHPIYVTFSVTERQFVSLLQRLNMSGDDLSETDARPEVSLVLPNGNTLDEKGQIVFIDNRVDPTTGSIALRAQFDNALGLISDGGFVTLKIAQSTPMQSLLIPQAAIQRDQRGDFALVVGSDGSVTQRYVTLGQQVETEVVVDDGLREGETVIVEGLQKVRPGATVDPVLAGQPVE